MSENSTYTRSTTPTTTASGWTGWIAFAAVLMMLLGIIHVIEGLVALLKDEFYVVGPRGLAVNVDYTTWGWTHLIGGVIVFIAGIGVLGGQIWARIVGVLLASLSLLASLAFMPAYPFWSLVTITLAVVVIMALTVHGSDIKPG
jgi:hypothetical protein